MRLPLTFGLLPLLMASSCLAIAITIRSAFDNDTAVASHAAPAGIDKRAPRTGGPLYGHGQIPPESDVDQGGAGNCWLAASVQLVAKVRPQYLKSLIDITAGTNHEAEEVMVRFPDSLMPLRKGYRTVKHAPVSVSYKRGGKKAANRDLIIKSGGNWWPGAVQRAMERTLGPQASDPDGSGISLSLQTLLQKPVMYWPLNNGNDPEHAKALSNIRMASNRRLTVIGTRPQKSTEARREFLREPGGGKSTKIDRFFVAKHAYGVLEYDQGRRQVHLLNPWGITPSLKIAEATKWYDLEAIAPYLTGVAQELLPETR